MDPYFFIAALKEPKEPENYLSFCEGSSFSGVVVSLSNSCPSSTPKLCDNLKRVMKRGLPRPRSISPRIEWFTPAIDASFAIDSFSDLRRERSLSPRST